MCVRVRVHVCVCTYVCVSVRVHVRTCACVCPTAQGHIEQLIDEHFSGQKEYALKDPLLFGDYRTALNPDVPRLYEDIQDYEAVKAIFDEVRSK